MYDWRTNDDYYILVGPNKDWNGIKSKLVVPALLGRQWTGFCTQAKFKLGWCWWVQVAITRAHLCARVGARVILLLQHPSPFVWVSGAWV